MTVLRFSLPIVSAVYCLFFPLPPPNLTEEWSVYQILQINQINQIKSNQYSLMSNFLLDNFSASGIKWISCVDIMMMMVVVVLWPQKFENKFTGRAFVFFVFENLLPWQSHIRTGNKRTNKNAHAVFYLVTFAILMFFSLCRSFSFYCCCYSSSCGCRVCRSRWWSFVDALSIKIGVSTFQTDILQLEKTQQIQSDNLISKMNLWRERKKTVGSQMKWNQMTTNRTQHSINFKLN